jgi:histidinol-phosphate phosphatase family protein
VTNQQGIGKGLMKMEDVRQIHDFLLSNINKNGGKISQIYVAPQLVSDNSIMRKPEIGMALKSKIDHPEIDLKKSIMVGDSLSDMKFGKESGMKTFFITDKELNHSDVDYEVLSLGGIMKYIEVEKEQYENEG